MGIEELAQAYIDGCHARGRAEKTVRDYAATLRRLAAWLDAQPLTQDTIRAYFHHLQDGSRSPETIRTYARTIRAFLAWAHREGHTAEDLSKAVPMPRKPRRRPKSVKPGTLEALLETCQGQDDQDLRDRALILILADTGARASEICRLRHQDLAEGLRSAIVRGKGDRERLVYFHPITQGALRAWLEAKPPGDYIFPALGGHTPGEPITPSGLRKMLSRRAEAAGIEGHVNPHAFRHFFALAYLRNGADIVSLAALLGHSDLAVTREYLRWTNRDLEQRHRRYTPINNL